MKRLLLPVAAVTPVVMMVLLMVLFAPANALAQNYGPPPATADTGPVILDLSGQPLPGGGNTSYQPYTADFTATQTSATIMFAFRDDPAAISFTNVSLIDLTANSTVPLANDDFSQGLLGGPPNSWLYAPGTGQNPTYQGVVATGVSDCYTQPYCWFDGSQQGYDTISQTVPNLIVGHNYQIGFLVAEGSFCSTNGAGLTCNYSDTSSATIAGIDVVVYVLGGTPVGSQTLTLALLDGGTGTVTDNVGTLTVSNCYEAGGTVFQNGSAQASGTCTATYPVGTPVRLTATPNVPTATDPPSTFGAAASAQSQAIPGWGGVCPNGKNGNTCNITMNSAESVTAAFVEPGLASSQPLSTDPNNPTTFPFDGGFQQGNGGFDFTGFLTDGTPSTTGVVNALSTDPATCNAIIGAAFPGAYCFVYQLGANPAEPPDSAQMFELTCPALPGGTCGSVEAANFFATLGSDFNFDLNSENPGLSTIGDEPNQILLYGGGNPYVGVVKFEGPDPYHPCFLPDGQTAPSPTNQVISFTFIDGGTGAKPVKSGSGGTGSCWIVTYNMPNEAPTVSITAGPTDGEDIGLGTPLSTTFTCNAVNNSNVSVGGQAVGAVGPYLTVNSCTLTDTYSVAGNPVTDTITATAGAASATGSGSIDTTNPGPHTLVATVMDSAENTISTSTITYNVQGSSTTAVTSSANPSVYGQLVTFTASVSGVGTATGQVTWTGIPGCTTTNLSSGMATCSISTLGVGGPYPVSAAYAGDNYNSVSQAALAQSVTKANTTTSVSSSGASVSGQSVTFTATVAVVAPGVATPTGSVTWSANTGCAPGLTCTTSGLAPGSDTVTATYAGDTNTSGSSGSLSQTVSQASTTTTVVSSLNPSVSGQSVKFTATVAVVAPGVATPTGSVTWSANTGCAPGLTCTTSGLAPGSDTVTATYAGDTNTSGSSGSVSQSVSKASTTTTVVSSLNPSVSGQSVKFTATVAVVAPSVATPTGSVTWSANTGCAAGLTCTTSSLPQGSDTVTANYSGDANTNASSGSVSQVVNAPPAWTVTPATYNFPTSSAGQRPSYTFTVTNPVGGATTSIYVSIPASGNEGGSTPNEVDADDYIITSNGCKNVSLSGGQSCNVTVTWYPDSNDIGINHGASLAYLQVSNSSTKKVLAYSTMTGTVIDPTVSLAVSGNSFVSKTKVTQMVATLTNPATQPTVLILGNLYINGGSSYFKLTSGSNSCTNGGTLTPNTSCNIYVTFTPPSGSGTVTGQVTIPSNAANGTLTVSLSGKRQ